MAAKVSWDHFSSELFSVFSRPHRLRRKREKFFFYVYFIISNVELR